MQSDFTYEYLENVTRSSKREDTHDKIKLEENTPDKIKLLDSILHQINVVRIFFDKKFKDDDYAKVLGYKTNKAERYRVMLIQLHKEIGLSIEDNTLMGVLKSRGKITPPTKEQSYTKYINSFLPDMIKTGFTKTDFNTIYRPALKRYLKNKQEDPFQTLQH